MRIKNLNPMIAAQLKLILKRSDIRVELKREAGVDTYTVVDPMGKKLIEYTNGWDYGLYSIDVMEQNVASIEWYENANKTTPEQKAVFDIFDLIRKKYEEQVTAEKALASMSKEDKALMDMLQQYTNEAQK